MTAAWTLTEHACKSCHGRLLASIDCDADGPLRYRCAQCGSECGPRDPETALIPICCCSVMVGGKPQMRCVRVGEPRQPGWPEVAAQLLEATASSEARRPRVVAGD